MSTSSISIILNDDDITKKSLIELIQCCICKEVALYDMYECNNNHVICHTCFTHSHFKSYNGCPICRDSHGFKTNIVWAKKILEMVESCCPLCHDIVKLSNMKRHLEHRCENRLYVCACKKYYNYHNLVRHISSNATNDHSDCFCRIRISTKCSETIQLNEDVLKNDDHLLLHNPIAEVGILFEMNQLKTSEIYASYISKDKCMDFHCKCIVKYENMKILWSGAIKRFHGDHNHNGGTRILITPNEYTEHKIVITYSYHKLPSIRKNKKPKIIVNDERDDK